MFSRLVELWLPLQSLGLETSTMDGGKRCISTLQNQTIRTAIAATYERLAPIIVTVCRVQNIQDEEVNDVRIPKVWISALFFGTCSLVRTKSVATRVTEILLSSRVSLKGFSAVHPYLWVHGRARGVDPHNMQMFSPLCESFDSFFAFLKQQPK